MSSMDIYLIVIVVCLFMSAFFSASETAFSTSNKIRLKTISESGNRRAKSTLKLIDNFDSLISSILIGNNIVNILSTSLATILFVTWLGEQKGPTVCTIVTTLVVLIFGEVTPKSIAKEYPEAFAMFATPFLSLVVIICTPFNYLFGLWKKVIGYVLKQNKNISTTEEELLMFVKETAQEGTITEEESVMIHNVIQFSDLTVEDILTPRVDVVSIDINSSTDTIKDTFKKSGYSRLPVYEDDTTNIVGSIFYKDFYDEVIFGDKSIRDIVKPIKCVLTSKRIKELLEEMKEEQSHIALVANEFGYISGIVTLEDIIEEFVGEIWDEDDDVTLDIIKVNENQYQVQGMTSLRKLSMELGINFNNNKFSTINGFVISMLGKFPNVGEVVTYNNMSMEVVSINKTRIQELLITLEAEKIS